MDVDVKGYIAVSCGSGSGGMSPCMAEFARLRVDLEKKGMAAKEASQRKVSRDEMCKYVTTYAAAEETWVKFTVSGIQSCGIPAQVADQLKQTHANTGQTKEKLCAAGPVGTPVFRTERQRNPAPSGPSID